MRGAVLYGPRDVRFEERDIPKILKDADRSTEPRDVPRGNESQISSAAVPCVPEYCRGA